MVKILNGNHTACISQEDDLEGYRLTITVNRNFTVYNRVLKTERSCNRVMKRFEELKDEIYNMIPDKSNKKMQKHEDRVEAYISQLEEMKRGTSDCENTECIKDRVDAFDTAINLCKNMLLNIG